MIQARISAVISLGALIAACSAPDPLLAHYLKHRTAIADQDWEWITAHLSHEFLAGHSSDLLAATGAGEVDGQRKQFWNQATHMRHDRTICAAASRFDDFANRGTLELAVVRGDGRPLSVSYHFVRDGHEWLLDSIYIYTASHAKSRNLACEEPLMELAPIPDRFAPVV